MDRRDDHLVSTLTATVAIRQLTSAPGHATLKLKELAMSKISKKLGARLSFLTLATAVALPYGAMAGLLSLLAYPSPQIPNEISYEIGVRLDTQEYLLKEGEGVGVQPRPKSKLLNMGSLKE